MLIIPALVGIILLSFYQALCAPGDTKICTWKDNKKAVISITIDDNCWKDVAFVTSVANPKGIKVTWALITGLIGGASYDFFGTWENWRTIPSMGIGHELASHGVITGSVLDLKTDTEIVANYRDSKLSIEKNVPANGKCLSIIYHYDYPKQQYFSIMPEYYIVGRGMNGGLNTASPSRDILADCGMWRLCTHDRTSAAIDQAISQGKWYIWFSHEINDKGGNVPTSVFSGFCNYAYSKRDLLWFAAMREAAQYIHERDTSTVQVVSVAQSRILLNLTHTLNTAVCDFTYPLTLKTEVYDAWNAVKVVQGDDTADVKITGESGKKYVYYDARPNSGQIALTGEGTVGSQSFATIKTIPAVVHFKRIINADRLRRLTGERGWRVFDYNGRIVSQGVIPGGMYFIVGPGSMASVLVVL